MFKDPPQGLVREAWRILLVVTDGKQLLPGHVLDYWKRHVTRWEHEAPVSDSAESSSESSPSPAKARTME